MSTPARGLLVEALRSQGRPVRFRRGQALFSEGDVAERVLIIEHGGNTDTATTQMFSLSDDGTES